MNEALAYCDVCPRRCVLAAGQTGPCQARMGWDGQSVSLYEGLAVVVRDDPIEKKYLYHFAPGTMVRTLGFGGCSLKCSFCQNGKLSHGVVTPEHRLSEVLDREIHRDRQDRQDTDLDREIHRDGQDIQISQKGRIPRPLKGPPALVPDLVPYPVHPVYPCKNSVQGVAFSYNEPTLAWENVCRVGQTALDHGLFVVLNTNGYLTEETRNRLAWVPAWSIGMKGASLAYQSAALGLAASAEPVWQTVAWAIEHAAHVEVSVVLFPEPPGATEQFFLEWGQRIGWNVIPLHLQKGFARHRYTGPVYSDEEMVDLWQWAQRRSPWVYLHNVLHPGVRDTLCPRCGQEVVIQRTLVRPDWVRDCPCCGVVKERRALRAGREVGNMPLGYEIDLEVDGHA